MNVTIFDVKSVLPSMLGCFQGLILHLSQLKNQFLGLVIENLFCLDFLRKVRLSYSFFIYFTVVF